MGSGDWFKTIISLKKVKRSASKKGSVHFGNDPANGNSSAVDKAVQEFAAVRIQTAYRRHRARKTLRCMKGIRRLQTLTQNDSVKKQATTTLTHLHLWSKMQEHIRTRRIYMVTDSRLKQKKLENQLKLEAKLHDVEVEWCSGSETMEEILSRIHQREEAAVKRERALAYAFSHQWRANASQSLGPVSDELGKHSWGWSWKERWITARPWESRVSASPKKALRRQVSKASNENTPSPNTKALVSKPSLSYGKGYMKARRLSFPPEKRATLEEPNTKMMQLVS